MLLKTEPYYTMGLTLKTANLGTIVINKVVTQFAEDNGAETQWTLDDIRTVFGILTLSKFQCILKML